MEKSLTAVDQQRVTVFGLGHFGGGIAVSRWLVENGARVLVVDQSPAERLAEPLAQLTGLPIEFHLGAESRETDFTNTDLVIASPAISPDNPYLQAARRAGVAVTTEICLFIERCPANVIGITGTKGKSTTSTLLGKMLATQFTVWVGGNIGRSLLPDLAKIRADDLVVLELSSFMLDHLGARQWSPHIAVVSMVSADHLDWHGSIEKYIDAKRNIVRFQNSDAFAVLNQDNETARSFSNNTAARVIPFGLDAHRRFTIALAGEHNQLNAQAAFAAASIVGIPWEKAQAAIADFRGLDHRLQVVAEHDGVTFINDSIATIPEAAIAALHSFPPGKVIQIVGGSDKKHLPIDELCAALSVDAKAVLCIGETGPRIYTLMTALNHRSEMVVRDCGTLKAAVAAARSLAVPGDNVLLSPGHPSYDQFINFEQRGLAFTTELSALQ